MCLAVRVASPKAKGGAHGRESLILLLQADSKCVPVLVLFICCNPDQPHHTFAVGANRALCQSIGKVNCPKRHSKYLLEKA